MDLSTARARIHALLPILDNPTEAETRETDLDQRIDDLLAAAQARITELETQREALTARLRAGQRWQQRRTQPLVSQDYVSQDELRAIFGIPLTPPWESTAMPDNATQPYCTGDRCEDCSPEEECCEATCGCCPRVDEHDHCRLAPGSEEHSKNCDQHGEGWLYARSPEAERRYQILRNA